MSRKLITLDELRDYCIANSLYSFQSKNDNEVLLVTVPAKIKCYDTDDDQAVYLNIKACHTKENANHSYIADETMEEALPSFQLKPILASIVEKTDKDGNTTLDFNGHDMEIENDKMNPDEERIKYIEQVVGVVSPDNIHMEAEEGSDKQYVYATGIVFRDYTYAADILEERKDVDVSVEIAVTDFSYDTKLGVLMIDKFQFTGITLLGSSVKPGMVGSHASLQTYTQPDDTGMGLSNQLMDELAQAIRKFYLLMTRLSGTKEGETMTKFEELLAQYNVTEEDVTFEHENMSDEELGSAFAEAFGEAADSEVGTDSGEAEGTEAASEENDNTFDDDAVDGESESQCDSGTDGNDALDGEDTSDEGDADNYSLKYSVQAGDQVKEFEISLEEKIDALSRLVNSVYEDDNTWYSVTVYEDYLVMSDWWDNAYYKQSYTLQDGVYTLTGDRVQVYVQFLTDEEIVSLDEMRQNYSDLVSFKEQTEQNALHAEREAILQDSRYTIMADDEKYQALVAHMDNYSIEDLTKEIKALHSDFVNEHPEFLSFSKKETPSSPRKIAYGMMFGSSDDDNGQKPYGNLFKK